MVALLDEEKLARENTRAVALSVAFAAMLTTLGLQIWLWPTSLSSVANAYQEACARNPYLLSWTNHVLPLFPIFLVCLVVSSLIAASWTLRSQLEMDRRLLRTIRRNAVPIPRKLAKAAAGLPILDRVICVSDPRLFAFCQGLRKPQICVSTGLIDRLSQEEIRAVLLHESSHLLNRDPVKFLGTRVLASALQMLPVVYELQQRYQLAREISADRLAVQGTNVTALANALLKVIASDQSRVELANAPVGAFDVTRERIVRLAGAGPDKPPIPRRSVISSLLVAIALFISTLGFAEASEYWAARGHDCKPVLSVHKTKTHSVDIGLPNCRHVGNYDNTVLER